MYTLYTWVIEIIIILYNISLKNKGALLFEREKPEMITLTQDKIWQIMFLSYSIKNIKL